MTFTDALTHDTIRPLLNTAFIDNQMAKFEGLGEYQMPNALENVRGIFNLMFSGSEPESFVIESLQYEIEMQKHD